MSQESSPQAPPDGSQAAADRVMRVLNTLALVRTRFSSERSLMSMMRTSVSLYTFGFSVTQFFGSEGEGAAGADRLGMILVCLGILVLVLAGAEHITRLRKMKRLGLPSISRLSLAACGTAALLAIGLVTLAGIVLGPSP